MPDAIPLSRFATDAVEPVLPPLRVGALGAARITPMALLRPARRIAEVSVAAVAARDPERARKFARRHRIPRVHQSYEALLADPDVEAIYNPLPNGLHCEWTLRALEAGKHVLCEKPIAANAIEALAMAECAEQNGRVLMEAFHWQYHPLAARLREILGSGQIGAIRHFEIQTCIPMPLPGDIRYRFDLAGGALMDIGSYGVNMLRYLARAEPRVLRARAKLASPQVDRFMRADLAFDDGRTARLTASLFSARLLALHIRVVGDRGELSCLNPLAPHLYHRLKVVAGGRTSVERVAGEASYTHQLRAFAAAVAGKTAVATDGADAVANMTVIDALYQAAGLKRRGT